MPVPLPRNGKADHFTATLRDLLRARLAGAARGPHRPADADYLFADDAELEVAIVADWLAVAPSTGRRWWTSVVGTAPPLDRWRRHILHDAVRLPRIVTRLVEAGCAAEWLVRFEPGELICATDRMLLALGVAAAPLWVATADRSTRLAPAIAQPSASYLAIRQHRIAMIAPEARSFASEPTRVFAAIALVLARRPALVATSGFVDAVRRFAASPATASVPTPRLAQPTASARPAAVAITRRIAPPPNAAPQ